MHLSERDVDYLTTAVDLAKRALEAGDEPFGSVLVDHAGQVLFQDHNHVVAAEATAHPELAIARWAGEHLRPEQRAECTVYTSTEHCPMCAAAHGWAGLGRVVYASSGAQVAQWRGEWGLEPGPVAVLPIRSVVPDAVVAGPHPALAQQVRELLRRYHGLVAEAEAAPQVTALAVNIAVPEHLQWRDSRRGQQFQLTSVTVRQLPDGTVAAKAYGRPVDGGRGGYTSFPVPRTAELERLVLDGARTAGLRWAETRGW